MEAETSFAKRVVDKGEDLRYQMIGRYMNNRTWESMNFKKMSVWQGNIEARGNDALGFWNCEGNFCILTDETGAPLDDDFDGQADIDLILNKLYKNAPEVTIRGRFLQNHYTVEEGEWWFNNNEEKKQPCQIKIAIPKWEGTRTNNGKKEQAEAWFAIDDTGLLDGFNYSDDKYVLYQGEIDPKSESLTISEKHSGDKSETFYTGTMSVDGSHDVFTGTWKNSVRGTGGDFELRHTHHLTTLDW